MIRPISTVFDPLHRIPKRLIGVNFCDPTVLTFPLIFAGRLADLVMIDDVTHKLVTECMYYLFLVCHDVAPRIMKKSAMP
jgi:hypothetical protein